jgi:hypothetical protein
MDRTRESDLISFAVAWREAAFAKLLAWAPCQSTHDGINAPAPERCMAIPDGIDPVPSPTMHKQSTC